MLEDRLHFCFLVAVLGLTTAGARADSGYLASVGPAPLRFQVMGPRAARVLALPPVVAATSMPAAPPIQTVNPSPEPAVEPAAAPAQLTAVSNPPTGPVEPLAAEPAVSPQMLLRFFNKSTNGVTSGVLAPVDFTPPRAQDRPASKATYTTTP